MHCSHPLGCSAANIALASPTYRGVVRRTLLWKPSSHKCNSEAVPKIAKIYLPAGNKSLTVVCASCSQCFACVAKHHANVAWCKSFEHSTDYLRLNLKGHQVSI